MKSLIIGIARTGRPTSYLLNSDTKYISLCGDNPEVSFSIDCEQGEFIQTVSQLRYDDADPASSSEAIDSLEKLVTDIFDSLHYVQLDPNDLSPLHIRLVTTPFELAQLPFEFALAPSNIANGKKLSLLANDVKKITLTREVRQESEARYEWPYKPRILFAWSQPDPKMTVPYKEHLAVLQAIVTPLAKPDKTKFDPIPDIKEFLTVLPDASIASIKQAIQQAIEDKLPYTHIHMLAHGGAKLIANTAVEFQLILCKEGTNNVVQKVSGETLAKNIIPGSPGTIPTVVSLSVCDSGHVGNTILPGGSLVYQLHNKGIPCVFASQFPLTQQGSVKLVKILFDQLINACDPRIALYETRMALRNEQNHDWASLVAYARFPQDINEQLQAVNLKMLFSSMKVTNAWVDHVFKFWEKIEDGNKAAALATLHSRLDKSISDLSKLLNETKESILETPMLQAEHLGLLASAYKRKAEYLYRRIEFKPEEKTALSDQSAAALEQAKAFYNRGLDANPVSHWTTMQYLSLKAVTEGSLKDENELWYVTKRMAQREEKNAKTLEDRIWAWGTLAELYMLKPLTGSTSTDEQEMITANKTAADYLKNLAAADALFNGAKESTARQVDRYITWWPKLFPATYPAMIGESARALRALLPNLNDLL